MKNSGGLIGALLIGVAVGAAIVILVAPDKGSETRKKLMDGAKDLADDWKEKIKDGASKLSDLTKMAQDNMDDVSKKANSYS